MFAEIFLHFLYECDPIACIRGEPLDLGIMLESPQGRAQAAHGIVDTCRVDEHTQEIAYFLRYFKRYQGYYQPYFFTRAGQLSWPEATVSRRKYRINVI